MKILSLSGGAAAFSGIAGAGIKFMQLGYKPDLILGISSGAIASIPLALGLYKEAQEKGDNLTPDKFFVEGKHPITKKGNVHPSAIFRLIGGAISLGEQDVKPLLREVITEDLWHEYKAQKYGRYADCIVGAVRAFDGKFVMWNLRECNTREQAFEKIEASSRITPIVQPQRVTENEETYDFIDGGFRAHNMAGKFLDKNPNLKVDELVSVFARPKDFQDINHHWADSFGNVTIRGYEIMNMEISKKDEYMEIIEMNKRGIANKHVQIFMPLLSGKYATGEELKKLRLIAESNAEIEYLKTYNA